MGAAGAVAGGVGTQLREGPVIELSNLDFLGR